MTTGQTFAVVAAGLVVGIVAYCYWRSSSPPTTGDATGPDIQREPPTTPTTSPPARQLGRLTLTNRRSFA